MEVGLPDHGDLVPVEVDRCLAPWLADPTDRARLDREHAVAHGCERGHLLARDRPAEGPRGDVVTPTHVGEPGAQARRDPGADVLRVDARSGHEGHIQRHRARWRGPR